MILMIWCFILHFIADGLMQSREMGQKKSAEFGWLLRHLKIQVMVFWVGLFLFLLTMNFSAPIPWWFIIFFAAYKGAAFALWNAVFHGVIDWYIWRGYKAISFAKILKVCSEKYGYWTQPPEEDLNVKAEIAAFKYWEDKLFYDTIMFDQLLHIITITALCFWIFL